VLVIGDTILDRYVWGDAERVSQEAPVILLRRDRDEIRLGGAANVANMLRGLQANVALASVVGTDADGAEICAALKASSVDTSTLLTDKSRPTTVKERFIGRAQHRHPHQILRVDREVRDPLSQELTEQLLEALIPRLMEFQVVVVADYGKGFCTADLLRQLISAARALEIPVIVDPRPNGNCEIYSGATAIKPNRLEAERATGCNIRSPEDALIAGRALCSRLALDYAIITLDSDGLAIVQSTGSFEWLPTRRREVYDITGAGDVVLATIGLGVAEGLSLNDIGVLANTAGGLEVEQIGVVPISRQEIIADLMAHSWSPSEKLCDLDALERQISVRRKLGQRIVFTNGCFDVLHIGHVSYLQQAAEEGDCLVVAINSDTSVRSLGKGADRPIFPQSQRAAMLAALEVVDYVTVFDSPTPHALLERLRPDLLVKGGAYHPQEIVGREIVEAYGGIVKSLDEVSGVSSSKILSRLRGEPPDGWLRKAG
jgi:D-beta-D-heptose 7-phosphate kinase/D-beta-D-heptose 1-phosphate adenosyltransferase